MLTSAEKSYLALTLAFLVAGSGIKAWRRATITVGPVPDAVTLALDSSRVQADSVRAENDTAGRVDPFPDTLAVKDSSKPDSPQESPRTAAKARISPKGKMAGDQQGKVDLNHAGADELMRVKGIGEKTAQAIIEHRRSQGPFQNLRDLLQIKGIGEKKLEKLTPFLLL